MTHATLERGPRGRGMLFVLAACLSCAFGLGPGLARGYAEQPAKPLFKEIWAYLMRGEEKELSGDEPITDVFLFGAGVNNEGRITEKIARPDIVLRDGAKPDVHLVIADLSNSALMHFSLDPEYGVQPQLIDDICRLAGSFDGVQIDFEAVSGSDAAYFLDFLAKLRARLPAQKMLSVAVPARTQPVSDAYDYPRIASIADRIVVMAYDEHWSNSAPGPVASLPWCSKVVDYARSTVRPDKIVMGLPLYGRAWQDKKLAKALRFKNVQDIIAEKSATAAYASETGASFAYTESVVVTVFYDDDRSLEEKLRLYRARNIEAVSFWRIGLGSPALWDSVGTDSATMAALETSAPAPSLQQ